MDETVLLSNVKVHFLPPNTTAHLQPLDAGIINSFKAQYRKLLVMNRVEAYDLAQEDDSDITSVDILDAITFVNEAWKIVKPSTIERCWKKMGILPDYEEYDSEESDSEENDLDQEINEITSELQVMIDALNLQDPMAAEEFIRIDDEIPIEPLSDEDIIDAVISNPRKNDIEEEEEEPTEINIITNKEVLNSLKRVIQYFKNPPDNVSINYTELKFLSTLKSKINRCIQDNTKQSTLDNFVQC
ncbi:unnamed protein product [Rhizophagus irregularis]|nr:unnamed protein product [Rhizophagus irregularis]